MKTKKTENLLQDAFQRYYKRELLRPQEVVNTELLILRIISLNPHVTQRKISKSLGISLGKTNYVIKSFILKGFIKLQNFKKANNKKAYKYLLTKQGAKEKLELAECFLVYKVAEYDRIKNDITKLTHEIKSLNKDYDSNILR